MWLLALFIAVPMIEIAVFIQVGGLIGLWPTLALVLLTAILGTSLLRQQGRMALADLQRSFGELRDPAAPLAHGALIVFGGALLLTPGFFTDALGLGLMIPRVRAALLEKLRARLSHVSFQTAYHESPRPAEPEDDIIDVEFDDVTPRPTHHPGNSGWTKH